MPFKSKNKRKTYAKSWSKKNKAKQKSYNSAWRDKLKIWYFNYKSSSPCIICGESRPTVLEAHHVYPKNKSFSLHDGIKIGISIRRLEIEASKCITVCATHHRAYHTKSLYPEEQKIWDEKIKIFDKNSGTHDFGQPVSIAKKKKRTKKKFSILEDLLDVDNAQQI
jgi:hypothetical protein